jgi:Ribonuclease G/E
MSPADYRSYAAKLLTIAAGVNDHQSKAALLAMAQRWQHLAAQGEKNPQIGLVYETPEPRQQSEANLRRKKD